VGDFLGVVRLFHAQFLQRGCEFTEKSAAQFACIERFVFGQDFEGDSRGLIGVERRVGELQLNFVAEYFERFFLHFDLGYKGLEDLAGRQHEFLGTIFLCDLAAWRNQVGFEAAGHAGPKWVLVAVCGLDC
jgi:hypothetical protein